jgi:hypothetical protein
MKHDVHLDKEQYILHHRKNTASPLKHLLSNVIGVQFLFIRRITLFFVGNFASLPVAYTTRVVEENHGITSATIIDVPAKDLPEYLPSVIQQHYRYTNQNIQ